MDRTQLNREQVTRFGNSSSFSGLLLIYAAKLSKDRQIAFDRVDFARRAYSSSEDYLNGFLVACSAIGLVDFNRKGNVITVKSINKDLEQLIEGFLDRKTVNNLAWKKDIARVNEYFKS
jgi:hypothetical protein